MFRVLPFRHLPLLALLLAFGVPLLAGCGGGGSSGSADDADLVVTYFSHGGRTDVYRNQLMEIRFSAPVAPESVTSRSIQFLTGPQQSTPADGALIVDGNRVYFDPTRTQETFDRDGPGATADRPFGLEALVDYTVYIPSVPVKKILTNRAGDPILAEYVASFRTSEEYVPELVQPHFVGVGEGPNGSPTLQLGFLPPQYLDEDPSSPTFGEVVVPYDAEVLIQFDEPISQISMEPAVTVLFKNQDIRDFRGDPVDVPGTLSPSMDGSLYTFTPSFNFGRGPFTIALVLTSDIADLAGNPIANPRTIYFNTEYEANVNNVGIVTESFSSSFREDRFNTTAEWNSTKKGELRGGAITTSIVTVDYPPDGINSRNANGDLPLVARQSGAACFAFPKGVRAQFSYAQTDLGSAGAISKIAWGPDSNAVFAANYPNMQLRLGHTKNTSGALGATFDDNFQNGLPLANYDGRYDVPQSSNIDPDRPNAFFPFPTLTNPFDYDGVQGLVIDFQVDPADNCQTLRGWFWGLFAGGPGNRMIAATTKTGAVDDYTGGGQPWIFDMQFTRRRRITTAQSVYYNTARTTPHYSDPIVSPTAQVGGASYTLEFQGSDGIDDGRGRIVPDPLTETVWSTNIDTVDAKRFIRFRFVLFANLNSETVPRITQIQMPYEF